MAEAALRLAWTQLRRRFGREIVVIGLLCLGIATVLKVIGNGPFWVQLTYSLFIGFSCTLAIDALRLLFTAAQDRLRARRGLAPLGRSGWGAALPAVLLMLLVAPSFGLWLGDQVTGHRSPSLWNLGSPITRLTLVLCVLGTAVAMAVLSTLERLSAARAATEAAQRAAAENQLRLLQSQLEPHMLFNTLANLRVLIGLDAAQAQAMLDRLIAFLRATLNASRSSTQPLQAEFTQLADYLALMAMRMGPRLAVQLDLPPELAAQPVPPLLLQPLVENAVKHGLEPKVQGGRIEVRARRDAGALRLTVRDTGVGLAAPGQAGTRFGLEQVRTRLATLYGARASFTLEAVADSEGGTLACIRLPLEPLPQTPNPNPEPSR